MPLSYYICCLWPGLPELWFRGKWTGVPTAIAFAIVLNVLLVARFIYPHWLEPVMVRVVFWGFVGIWLYLSIRAIRSLPTMLTPRLVSKKEDPFDRARSEYLKCRWYEAEALLIECLEIDSRDALALLLLASVYRQTDRLEAAQQTLDSLTSLETGDAWWMEIEIEQQRLQLAMDQVAEDSKELEESEITENENVAEPKDNASQVDSSEEDPSAKASSWSEDSATKKIAADLAESMQFSGFEDQSI